MTNKNKPIIFNEFIDKNCKVDSDIFYPIISISIINNNYTVVLRLEDVEALDNFFKRLRDAVIETKGNIEAMEDTILKEEE